MAKKKILVIAPNTWCAQEIAKRNNDYEFICIEDHFQSHKVSVFNKFRLFWGLSFERGLRDVLAQARRHKVDGILGADEFLSCLFASAASAALNLPGSHLKTELTLQHKYYSRQWQKKIVPEAVPDFGLLDLKTPPEPPFFVKPVRGSASLMAQIINTKKDLLDYQKIPRLRKCIYLRMLATFSRIAQARAGLPITKTPLIYEELLTGMQVTLEGLVYQGQNQILGIVDSVMYPNSRLGFARFELPSKLPSSVQERMKTLADRLVKEMPYPFGFYNIEFFYRPEHDDIKIIEINPRMAFQFTDLYEKVYGWNTFDLWLKLLTGEALPALGRAGKFARATSFVLRHFQNGYVEKAPSEQQIQGVQEKYPEARILIQAPEKTFLHEDIFQDMESYRLMTVNIGGDSEEELAEKLIKIQAALSFEIRPLESANRFKALRKILAPFNQNLRT
jgi:hypothetical protein